MPDEFELEHVCFIVNTLTYSKCHPVESNSIKRYGNYLSGVVGFFQTYFPTSCHDVRLIKSFYIKECIDKLIEEKVADRKPWSKRTVNGLLQVLKAMFAYALKQKYTEQNPITDVKDFSIPQTQNVKFYSDEELELIWTTIDPFWVDHMQFFVNTGLRKGELINLKWTNVSLDDSQPQLTITSTDEWETKTRQTRVIPLNKVAFEIIQRWVGKNPEYVFTLKNGEKIHPDKPYRALQTALNKLKLSGDIHKFRHTYAAKLVMAGVSLYVVSQLLGHSDTKATEIYAHLSPGYIKSAVVKLDKWSYKKFGMFKPRSN